MDIRRTMMGVIAGMAGSGSTIYHGTFTPESDLTEYVIDVGKQVHTLIIQVKDGVRESGVRNFGYAIMFEDSSGNVYEYGVASNSTGTSWAALYWNLAQSSSLPIIKNGTEYTVYPIRVAAGACFITGVEYEWYAI